MQFILTGLLCMMPVLSQAYEVNDSSRVIDLDEVIVISQPKESFLLRQQPVSSNVFGADEMHQLNVNDYRDFLTTGPNMAKMVKK